MRTFENTLRVGSPYSIQRSTVRSLVLRALASATLESKEPHLDRSQPGNRIRVMVTMRSKAHQAAEIISDR